MKYISSPGIYVDIDDNVAIYNADDNKLYISILIVMVINSSNEVANAYNNGL